MNREVILQKAGQLREQSAQFRNNLGMLHADLQRLKEQLNALYEDFTKTKENYKQLTGDNQTDGKVVYMAPKEMQSMAS